MILKISNILVGPISLFLFFSCLLYYQAKSCACQYYAPVKIHLFVNLETSLLQYQYGYVFTHQLRQ